MIHKQFNLSITKDIQITIHFDMDFDGQNISFQNIEFGNQNGKLGNITSLLDFPKINSINPEIYNEEVKEKILKEILRIANEETPKFDS